MFAASLICAALTMFGCDSSTKPKQGSIEGTVTLSNDSGNPANDPVDFGGITVTLYEMASIDTTLSRIKEVYPNIGGEINQQTEFDHRHQHPLRTVTTNADGSFSILGVDYGEYNVVASKPGWGWHYYLEVSLGKDGKLALATAELYPERILGPAYPSSLILASGHHYLAQGNVFFNGIEFQDNSWLRLNDHVDLTISGHYSCPSVGKAYIWQEAEGDPQTSTIHLANLESLNVQNMVYKDLSYPFNVSSIDGTIANCRIINCVSSLLARFSEISIYQVSSTVSGDASDGFGVEYSTLQIHDSIILGGVNGINVKMGSSAEISNNYIASTNAFRLDADTDSSVSHCCLEASDRAGVIVQTSLFDISRNVILGNKGFYFVSISMVPENSVAYNDFYSTSLYLEASGQLNPAYLSYHLNAKHNYFHRNTLDQINIYIKDMNDFDPSLTSALTFDIDPCSTTPVANCGIQAD
jgi:hypothetical protein